MIQREGNECSLCRGTSLRRDHHRERPQRRCDQKAQTCPTHPVFGGTTQCGGNRSGHSEALTPPL